MVCEILYTIFNKIKHMRKLIMKKNIQYIHFFIIVSIFCLLSLSNVYAFKKNNSTDLLQEDYICEPLCENITNINDTRINTYLNSSDVVKYYHGPERYGVYLFDDGGNALSNMNVSFILNGMTYKRITNDYGYASMGINLNSGNYSISCLFNGDTYYKPCNCSNWIFVNSTIFADDLIKYFRNSSQYYSLFFSANGAPLVNTTVTFNINGVFYNRTTNFGKNLLINTCVDYFLDKYFELLNFIFKYKGKFYGY